MSSKVIITEFPEEVQAGLGFMVYLSLPSECWRVQAATSTDLASQTTHWKTRNTVSSPFQISSGYQLKQSSAVHLNWRQWASHTLAVPITPSWKQPLGDLDLFIKSSGRQSSYLIVWSKEALRIWLLSLEKLRQVTPLLCALSNLLKHCPLWIFQTFIKKIKHVNKASADTVHKTVLTYQGSLKLHANIQSSCLMQQCNHTNSSETYNSFLINY